MNTNRVLMWLLVSLCVINLASILLGINDHAEDSSAIQYLNEKADYHKHRADSLEKLIPALHAKQQSLRDTITIVQNQRDVHYDTYIQVLDSINRAPYLTPEFQQCRTDWRQLIQDGFLTKRLRSR